MMSQTSLLSFLKTDNYKSFEKAPDTDQYNQTKSNDLELIKKLRTKLKCVENEHTIDLETKERECKKN